MSKPSIYSAFSPNQGHKKSTSRRGEIRARIQELLGMCQDENKEVNSEIGYTMNAEQEILTLLKERAARPQSPPFRPENDIPSYQQIYDRSNVRNFPDNDHYPSSNIIKSKVDELGEGNRGLRERPNYQQPAYTTGQSYNQTSYNAGQFYNGPDYSSNPTYQNNEAPYNNDLADLHEELNRLRRLVPQYQAQIQRLRAENSSRGSLQQLLEQGQIIRQQTIMLLRSSGMLKSSPRDEEFEVNKLRSRCQELQEENHRLSKETAYSGRQRSYGY